MTNARKSGQPLGVKERRYGDVAIKILDIAERLVQTRGYNGFSYADIAATMGVTKASLHYHFASKEALGCALIERYAQAFMGMLDSVSVPDRPAPDTLRYYVSLYESVIRNNRICLCGMLAAEFQTLPSTMQDALKQFFDMNERWLATVLAEGQRQRTLTFNESPKDRARVLLGALEGAMLVARSYGDPRRFSAAARSLVDDVRVVNGRMERKASAR